MRDVERMLERAFGVLVEDNGDDAVFIAFPGDLEPLFVHARTDGAVTLRVVIGRADFDRPGLADFLLQTHAHWIYGRFERDGPDLAVEHSLYADDVSPEQLADIVTRVYQAAQEAARTLRAVGVLPDAE